MTEFRENWLRGSKGLIALGILLLLTTFSSTIAVWKWQHDHSRLRPAAAKSRLPAKAAPAKSGLAHATNRTRTDGPHPVDLSRHYNADLTNAWHFRGGRGSATLRDLPQGVQEFGGIPFEVCGIVQLASARTGRNPSWPEQATDIPVGMQCRALHFLHATGWVVPDGTPIGAYWVRYADGSALEFPIVYGEHLREWHGRSDRRAEIKAGQLAWQDGNHGTKHRLFQCRWENPRPEAEVRTIDFVSAMTDCFPFLIAITAE